LPRALGPRGDGARLLRTGRWLTERVAEASQWEWSRTLLDKALATVSILALIGFMLIVTVFVNEPDLWIIVVAVVAVLAMAVYDFWRTFRQNGKGPAS